MNPIKSKEMGEHVILLVPLLLAFVWMAFLVLDTQSAGPEKLSPSKLNSLVNGLFSFILVYAVILSVVFYKMRKHKK